MDTVFGSIDAKTSGGHLTFSDIYGPVEARTSGGHISIAFPEGIADATELSASGGSVNAKLPADQAFHLDASAIGGRIETDFAVSAPAEKNFIKSKINTDVNGGGPSLKLRASGGNVQVKHL